MNPLAGLPLTVPTPAGWSAVALADVPALLADHAHCEHKATVSALAIVASHPEVPGLLRHMLALAHEEMRHFRQVLDHLEAAGGTLGSPPRDAYAGAMRRLAFTHPGGLGAAADVLVASAFIEARSCERFRLLAADPDAPETLARFYGTLAAAEARHWELFRDLAAGISGRAAVDARLAVLAPLEGRLMTALPPGPRIH